MIPDTPVVYEVDPIHDSGEYAKRIIRVLQHQNVVLIAMVSLVRIPRGRSGFDLQDMGPTNHWSTLSKGLNIQSIPPSDIHDELEGTHFSGHRIATSLPSLHDEPEKRRIQKWIRAQESNTKTATLQSQVEALAYISDMYFIGTAAEVHSLQRADLETKQAEYNSTDVKVSMMVTLSHSLYLLRPDLIHVEEWMLSEMESPWTGDGRALVLQRFCNEAGDLVATATQEA